MIEQNEVVSSEGTGGGHVRARGKTDEREFKTSPSPPVGRFGPGPGEKIRASKETRRHPGEASAWHNHALTTQLPLSRQKTLE